MYPTWTRKTPEPPYQKPLEDTAWRFSDGLISAIVRDTASYPYFIRFFCREIMIWIGKEHVAPDDCEKIGDRLMGDLGRDFFDRRIEPLSSAQRRVPHPAASLPRPDSGFSSIQRSLDADKGSPSNQLRRPDERGLIYKSKRGVYRLAVPLGKYLRLRVRPEWCPIVETPALCRFESANRAWRLQSRRHPCPTPAGAGSRQSRQHRQHRRHPCRGLPESPQAQRCPV